MKKDFKRTSSSTIRAVKREDLDATLNAALQAIRDAQAARQAGPKPK